MTDVKRKRTRSSKTTKTRASTRKPKTSSKAVSNEKLFKIQINEKLSSNSFSFEIEGKTLSSLLDSLTVITGFVNANNVMRKHLFVAYEGFLYLVGYSTDTHIAINTGIEVDVSGCFNIDAEILKRVINKRGAMQCDYDGSELKIVSGKFKSALKTNPITVDQIPAVNEIFVGISRKDAIGSELLNRLRVASQRTRVIDHHDDKAVSPMNISIKDDRLTVAVVNRWVINLMEADLSSGMGRDFNLVISSDIFNVVNRVLSEDDEDTASFFVEESGFRVLSDNVLIGLPPLQELDTKMLDHVIETFSDYENAPTDGMYSIPVKDSLDTLASIGTLMTSNQSGYVNLNFGKSGVEFAFSNEHGDVSNIIDYSKLPKTVKKNEVAIHPKILADVLNNVKEGSVMCKLKHLEGDSPTAITVYHKMTDDFGTINIRQTASLKQ